MKKICLYLFISVIMIIYNNNLTINTMYFNKLVNSVEKKAEFQENGVRVEYLSKISMKEELEKIKMNISNNHNINNLEIKDNNLVAKSDNEKIEANFCEDNGTTYVDINIINYRKTRNISTLMKELTNLQTDNCYKIKYFKYFKGKISKDKDILEYVEKTNLLNEVEMLNIHNGYVGTGNLCNGESVNFVNSSYDTGSYFFIGSPIIFATY